MRRLQEILQKRRTEIGIPYPDLAARSGVSVATAKRILCGQIERASLAHVEAVAKVMGVSLVPREDSPAHKVKERAAYQQANRLVRMVQGTSALESQALDSKQAEQLAHESVHRLMAGSPRRVWAR
jgi:transcriptional regulator with XRE-family HTH domain